jgi:hypothetical protein
MTERIARLAAGAAATAGLALGLAGGALGASTPPRPGELAPITEPYTPRIDPASFVARVDNRYFPLRPGTAWHFTGLVDGTRQTDDAVVLTRTKRILGVKATVVRDTVSEHGHPIELTFDYYAQDRQGNVWYMGEDAFDRVHGRFVKASDSWLGGVSSGKPGIIMPAQPRVGDAYRQEYYPPGKALDTARVISLNGKLKVGYGSFKHLLVTSDYSPAEPQTEHKYYAPGVGEIAERVVKGGHEAFQLLSVKRTP